MTTNANIGGLGDLPAVLDTSVLAEVLGLTENGVRAMLRRGELPSFRLGRRVLVRREALLAVIYRQERERRPVDDDDVTKMLRVLPPPKRKRGRKAP